MLWLLLLSIFLVVLLFFRNKLGNNLKNTDVETRMDGKTVIITGASSGMGEVIASNLATRGARVILACRDLSKAEVVRNRIIKICNNSNVSIEYLDFSNLKSVEKFCKRINKTEKRLDILINNAGIFYPIEKRTVDGNLTEMQVNHFGPFLLTYSLLDLLKKSAPSRIVTVSSVAHQFAQLNTNNLNEEFKLFGIFTSDFIDYSNSKLCTLLMAKHLAEHLYGTGVTSNACHPGFVHTNAHRNAPWFIKIMAKFRPTASTGAQTAIYLATSEDVANISGEYFINCQVERPSLQAQDPKLAEFVWNCTKKMVL